MVSGMPGGRPLAADLGRGLPWLIGIVIAYQFLQLATYRVGSEWAHVHGYRAGGLFYGSLAGAGVAVVVMLVFRRRASHAAFFIAIVAFAIMGAWTIRWQKPPFMDVWFNQKYALDHYLEGENPYAGRYPFIFAEYDAIPPGSGPLAAKTFENIGFAYTPWSFWLELPAHRWAGDLRYSLLACMILTAVLIAYLRPGPLGPLVAILYLFTPRAFFVLESAWTEPTVTFPLVLLLFVATRWPGLVPLFLGVFLVSKQYLVFAIAPAVLLLGRYTWRGTARAYLVAAVVGCLVSVPLIVWDFSAPAHGRWHDVMANVRAFHALRFRSRQRDGDGRRRAELYGLGSIELGHHAFDGGPFRAGGGLYPPAVAAMPQRRGRVCGRGRHGLPRLLFDGASGPLQLLLLHPRLFRRGCRGLGYRPTSAETDRYAGVG